MARKSVIIFLVVACVAFLTSCGYYHTVKRGDTIYSISQKYGVPQDKLMKENGVKDPRKLEVGKKLKIPRQGIRTVRANKRPGNKHHLKDKNTKDAVDRIRQQKNQGNQSTPPPGAIERKRIRFIWPTKGVIVRGFGKSGDGRINDGLDLAAPEGSKIVAAADGEVVLSSDKFPAYGHMIVVRHEGNFVTVYAHNRVNLVAQGDKVVKGQPIGEVGATGRVNSPTLHFEVRMRETPVNPLQYLPSQ